MMTDEDRNELHATFELVQDIATLVGKISDRLEKIDNELEPLRKFSTSPAARMMGVRV